MSTVSVIKQTTPLTDAGRSNKRTLISLPDFGACVLFKEIKDNPCVLGSGQLPAAGFVFTSAENLRK